MTGTLDTLAGVVLIALYARGAQPPAALAIRGAELVGIPLSNMIGPYTRRALLLLASVVVAVLWLDSITNSSAIEVGRELGDVQAELSDGGAFRLAEHRGEVVVLSFWATWCVPCRHEAPVLSRLHRAGVRVLGLSIDALPLQTVGEKAQAMGIAYPVGKAAAGLTERLGIRMVPTTCVVGRDGRVSMVQSGMISYDELHAAVEKASRR